MRDYAFGNLVTKLRTELGFSQFQLGKLIGVSDKAVSKWENGNAKPRIATCCRLADILGVSLDELLSAAGYAQKSQMELPDEDVEAVLMQEEKRITERQDSVLEKRIQLMRSSVNGIEQTIFIGIPQAASAAFSFPMPSNQKSSFFRLIGVEDNSDEETQFLCDQETERSVSSYFNPTPS